MAKLSFCSFCQRRVDRLPSCTNTQDINDISCNFYGGKLTLIVIGAHILNNPQSSTQHIGEELGIKRL